MKSTKVVSGFPAIGKSFLFDNQFNNTLTVIDSDSSKFSWLSEGIRHPEFPNNYMRHIKDNLGKVDIILISSHEVVRKALEENKIEYALVYPDISLKEEYIQRYKKRGSNEGFINFISSNWDDFIKEIEDEKFPSKIKLSSGQYLRDVI